MIDPIKNTIHHSSKNLKPVQTFELRESNFYQILKISRVLRFSWIALILMGILSFAFTSDTLMMAMFLTVALIIALLDLLMNLLRDPLDNTVIELFTDKIVRSGLGLKRAEIALKDFGKLWEDEKGVWIFKKGFKTTIKFYISDMTRVGERDIIFIPSNIENYKLLKEYLFSLKPE